MLHFLSFFLLFNGVFSTNYTDCDLPKTYCVEVSNSFPCSNCHTNNITGAVNLLDTSGGYTILLVGDPTFALTMFQESVTIYKATPEDITLANVIKPYRNHSIKWKNVGDQPIISIDNQWWKLTGDGGYLLMENDEYFDTHQRFISGRAGGGFIEKVSFRNDKTSQYWIIYLQCNADSGHALGWILSELIFHESAKIHENCIWLEGNCLGETYGKQPNSFTDRYGEDERVWIRNCKFYASGWSYIRGRHPTTVSGNYFAPIGYVSRVVSGWEIGWIGMNFYNNVIYYPSSFPQNWYRSVIQVLTGNGSAVNRVYNNHFIDLKGSLKENQNILHFDGDALFSSHKTYFYNNVVRSAHTDCFEFSYCMEPLERPRVYLLDNVQETNGASSETCWTQGNNCHPSSTFANLGGNYFGTIPFKLSGEKPFPYWDLTEDVFGLPFPSNDTFLLPSVDYNGVSRHNPLGFTTRGAFQYQCPSSCLIGGRKGCHKDSCECFAGYFGDSCQFEYQYCPSCREIDFCSFDHTTEEYFCDCQVEGEFDELCNYCKDGYYGEHCNITTCNGTFTNDSSVCSSVGDCYPEDFCDCEYEYFGSVCQYEYVNCPNCSHIRSFCDYNTTTNEYFCNCHFKDSSDSLCYCIDEYFGVYCNITTCEGIFTNETSCSGYGLCYPKDHCECDSGYFGDLCEETTCFGVLSNDSEVCSGNSDLCFPEDQCHCSSRSYGVYCNITECYGILSNESSVCSGKSTVCGPTLDSCYCQQDYYGDECNVTLCYGIYSNETSVCSGKSESCWPKDRCNCYDGYFGDFCNITLCYGYLSSDTENVCSGRSSKCWPLDHCNCLPEYLGFACNISSCYGYLTNDSFTCYQHGLCVDVDVCECDDLYFGENCNITTCYGLYSNSSSSLQQVVNLTCSGRGECVAFDDCDCFANHTGLQCEEWECFGVSNLNDYVCSGRGDCVDPGICNCTEPDAYTGENCQNKKCYGYSMTDVDNVCNGHGFCIEVDVCQCQWGYNSSFFNGPCTIFSCRGLERSDKKVCNGRGSCVSYDLCSCDDNYEGQFCETWSCGYDKNVYLTCSGNGECLAPDDCKCNPMFSGRKCENNLYLSTVMAPLLSIFVFGVIIVLIVSFCCFLCCVLLCVVLGILGCLTCISGMIFTIWRQRFGLKKFGKLKNFNLLLKEQELEEDDSIAHLRIRKELYKIEMNDVLLERVLGQGGSASVVYKAKWKGKRVAFKAFRTRDVCSSQMKFDEFEREVGVLSSVSHPSILQFYGCLLESPRIGIVMEFCENGDLQQFIDNYHDKNDQSYPLPQKLRVLYEVILGMEYLHDRNIIHRDLKLENILLDSQEHSKLMDFGLSRIVDQMSAVKTARVGTPFYMAPEIVKSQKYDTKIDVFSFAMICYILLTERTYNPYQENQFERSNPLIGIELKVANDPNFRPNLDALAEVDGYSNRKHSWIGDVVRRNWSHRPEERNNYTELSGIFEKGMEDCDVVVEDGETPREKVRKDMIVMSMGGEEEEIPDESWKDRYENLTRKHEIALLKLLEVDPDADLKELEDM